jgi:predicted phosphodiesterase
MRILVLSDIHANLAALEAVLAHAGQYDALWSLGDIVGYGPDPNACIERLAAWSSTAIAGNHDWAVLGKLDLADFNGDARKANLWTREQLTPASLAYLESLPEMRVLEGYTLVHGSPRAPVWEYLIYPNVAKASFAHFSTPVCWVGHTHLPVVFRDLPDSSQCQASRPAEEAPLALDDGRYIVNPGSVGQPRDGDARASYAILDTEARTMTNHRTMYDIARTQAQMHAAGLPRRNIERLTVGW